ncbi:GNAT family N-acetyltransferase [Halorubellus sp. JP-L1]|uniref:arsenic resistance N-acetyltransferase ArsN2 n=1 Tax=Halorubellus sp. JP-L1 TaxID=2715753 RepID=UPI00140A8174|nr:arsenic resistance N-acetyltransferase ArsN2 [Halorubellus sp. JP-L1]NHN42005.1 GNAT family N-acetyltransferase [Halorubellus sp. JP-L1]
MSDATVDLEPASGNALGDVEGLADVEALLAANDLPADDVREKPDAFYVAFDDGDAVGVGGVEVHDSAGLLRSLVVRDRVRGEGYGTAICDALEREAHDAGVTDLYLLTTTAADFFAARGYDVVDRAEAPDSLQGTAEFADLCPSSATCMRTSP